MSRPWSLALVHFPVTDRRGDEVTSAVTNLDIHDLARVACTYGAARFYLVTPLAEQQRLVEKLLAHWRTGYGAGYNPDRARALELVEVVTTLDAALGSFGQETGETPRPLLTGAKINGGLSIAAGRRLAEAEPVMLVLGTGWGLAPKLFTQGWPALAPITGTGDYNHLSVRAAAAIMCDRLWGAREEFGMGENPSPGK